MIDIHSHSEIQTKIHTRSQAKEINELNKKEELLPIGTKVKIKKKCSKIFCIS